MRAKSIEIKEVYNQNIFLSTDERTDGSRN
jgi:hypothetical protein